MNSRQRILATLNGSKPDRIPWIPLLSGTYFSSIPDYQRRFNLTWREGHVRPLEVLEYRVAFYRSIGADYMDWGATQPWDILSDTVITRSEIKDNREFVYHETPIGAIVQERGMSETAKTVFPVTSLLRSPKDYEVYAYILEHSEIVPRHDRVRAYLDVIGDAGVAFFSTPSPPIKDWVLSEILLDDLVFALADQPGPLEELEAKVHAQNVELHRVAAGSPAQVFIDYAVTGTGMISPRIFRDHYLAYTAEYASILHSAGKSYLNHCSGEPLQALLSMVARSGIDGLYGLSLPHFGHGDVTLTQIREALGPEITLIPGVEPHLMATGAEQQIKDATRYILDECAQVGGPVMLGTADDTPYGSPIRNLAAVSEVVEQYGYGL